MKTPVIASVLFLLMMLPPSGTLAADEDEAAAQREKGIRDLFGRIEKALLDGEPQALERAIDAKRCWATVTGWQRFPSGERPPRDGIVEQLGRTIAKKLVESPWLEGLRRFQVLRIEWFEETRTAVVLTLLRSRPGPSAKLRWWVSERNGAWAIFDFEDLSLSLRFTRIVGVTFAYLEGEGGPEQLGWLQELTAGAQALQRGDVETAVEHLEKIEGARFPPKIEAVAQIVRGALSLHERRGEEALLHAARAEALHADLPMVGLLRASALNLLGRHEEAIRQARRFQEKVGPDADAVFEEAHALGELGLAEKAVAACRRGLEVEDDHTALLAELGRRLPPDAKKEVAKRFLQVEDAADIFEDLVLEILDRDDGETAAHLIAAFRRLAPEDPNADYYDAELDLLAGRPDAAATKLLGALPRAPEDEREAYEARYADAMVEAGRALMAYEKVPTVAVFETVAYALDDEETVDDLAALVAAHTKRFPHDPELRVYAAEVQFLRREYEKLVSRLGKEREAILEDPSNRYWFDRVLVLALLRQGKHEEALIAAKASTEVDGDPWWEAVVLGVAGRAAELIPVVVRLLGLGYELEELYEDEDLGPALRGEKLAPVRVLFPPPLK